MIQLNLLPDVKLEYIKTQRTKRLALSVSFLIIAVSVGLFIAMFSFVKGVQSKHLSNLENDINSGIATIQDSPGVNEILTIQNQLKVVEAKHQEKPAATRVLSFVAQLLPAGSKVTQIEVNFVDGTISVSGETANINDTNKLVDTMKFVNYKSGEEAKGRAFSEVVLSSFSTASDKSTFSIEAKFDPAIFNNQEKISLVIPGIVSTRSDTEKPVIEFTAPTGQQTEGTEQ